MSICKKIHHAITELEELYQEKPKIQTTTNTDPEIVIDPNLNIAKTPIQFMKGVGPQVAVKLQKLGINTIEDLLNYLPRDHVEYSQVTPIASLELEQDASIMGQIFKITSFKTQKKNLTILSIIIKDHSGQIKINKFFQGQSAQYFLKMELAKYPKGAYCLAVGKVKADKFSKQKTLHNAFLEVISDDFSEKDRQGSTAQIVPIYPLTEGVSLSLLRRLIRKGLDLYSKNIHEFIPLDILKNHNLFTYLEALEEVHFPSSIEHKNQSMRRLQFNDLFLMQIRFMQLRHIHKTKHKGIRFNVFDHGLVDLFIQSLPFELTFAQQRVFYNEILPDMCSSEPMHRLLQGDVGSGKTVVAFLALLVAIADGYQAAMMVPTEILAEQHYKKFLQWLEAMEQTQGSALPIKAGLLLGKQKTKEKKSILEGLANGNINLIVGTHALIQKTVNFHRLGLIIIDEQHRFGVKQRELLAHKAIASQENIQLNLNDQNTEISKIDESNLSVEKLFMTATPIPRTLALASHGDLDMSEIDELPSGRLPIITKHIKRKQEAYNLIQTEILKGNQAYIVFPLIDESETLSAKAATVEYEDLKETVFANCRLGLIHGKLADEEKEQVMEAFRRGDLDILIATTVIEVGVDVANATVILIESAERFGLAQLHQLRGRVGRNDKQSYCLLASSTRNETINLRLSILEKSNNGFVIAQEDLKLRGSGDITGIKQSGIPDCLTNNLIDAEEMMLIARSEARKIIEANPELNNLNELKHKLERFTQNAHLNAG